MYICLVETMVYNKQFISDKKEKILRISFKTFIIDKQKTKKKMRADACSSNFYSTRTSTRTCWFAEPLLNHVYHY